MTPEQSQLGHPLNDFSNEAGMYPCPFCIAGIARMGVRFENRGRLSSILHHVLTVTYVLDCSAFSIDEVEERRIQIEKCIGSLIDSYLRVPSSFYLRQYQVGERCPNQSPQDFTQLTFVLPWDSFRKRFNTILSIIFTGKKFQLLQELTHMDMIYSILTYLWFTTSILVKVEQNNGTMIRHGEIKTNIHT